MTEPVEEVSENDYTVSMRRQYEEYVERFPGAGQGRPGQEVL